MRSAIWIAVVVFVEATATYASFQLSRASTLTFWLMVGGPTIALAMLAALRLTAGNKLKALLRPVWGDATVGVLTGLLFLFASWGVARFLVGTPRESWLARIYLQLGDPSDLKSHAAYVGGALVVFAIAEELVWRGLVTALVSELVGARAAWIVAAILYSLAHVPAMWALRDPVAGLNPLLPLAALGGGLLWGGMTRRFGRLPPAIISHALFDWCVVMMFRLWGMSV